jgi:hypothetical protein
MPMKIVVAEFLGTGNPPARSTGPVASRSVDIDLDVVRYPAE